MESTRGDFDIAHDRSIERSLALPADDRPLDTWVIFQSRSVARPTSSVPSYVVPSFFFITLARRRRRRLNCASDWNFKSCSRLGIFFVSRGPDMATECGRGTTLFIILTRRSTPASLGRRMVLGRSPLSLLPSSVHPYMVEGKLSFLPAMTAKPWMKICACELFLVTSNDEMGSFP